MTEEKLKLNFPKHGGDVFDKNNDDMYFVYSGSFSNTTNNLHDLSIEKLEGNISVGYKSIQVCKRIKLISNGSVSGDWEAEIEKEGRYILLTNREYNLYVPNWKREIETTIIYHPDFIDLSANSSIWQDFDDCLKCGIEFSKTKNSEILLSSQIELINWH